MSVVDDYGRFSAHPSLLRASCYPLRIDEVREADITRWLAEVQSAGLIALYAVEGKRYLEMLDFRQQVRAKQSKFPPPPKKGSCNEDAQQTRSRCAADAHLDEGAVGDGDDSPPTPPRGERPASRARGKPSRRPPDKLFEAVVKACGYKLDGLTDTERGRANKACAELRKAGATTKEVNRRADIYRQKFPNAAVTPQAIAGNWSLLDQPGPGESPDEMPPGWNGASAEYCERVYGKEAANRKIPKHLAHMVPPPLSGFETPEELAEREAMIAKLIAAVDAEAERGVAA